MSVDCEATRANAVDDCRCQTNGSATRSFEWPQKVDLFGVSLSPIKCDEACDAIIEAAQRRIPGIVLAFCVHALIAAVNSADLRAKVNRCAIIVPDGQPVRWALNWLRAVGLKSNVRGSDLMWQLCERAEADHVSVYLYGGTKETLDALTARLRTAFPQLTIAGAESPPFRPLTDDEDTNMVDRINKSGAGLMFIGLGSPKQDEFAVMHTDRILAIQLCVGAAFDFHAGAKQSAPIWMQRHGIEWAFRLYQEPGRLWKRYLVTNTHFIGLLICHLTLHSLRKVTSVGRSARDPKSRATDPLYPS